jgi:serine/threonine protein kinase
MAGIYETFGKYKLTERLAFGGMAEVFLATIHGEAGFVKPVVIKRLHPRLSEDSDFVQMLIDEARITAQLTHGNICQVLDLGSVDGSYYIAMEFVSGEDVRTLQDHCIRRGIPLPIEAAGHIVTELLAGLDYAHRKEGPDGKPLGIIHRDISPQNVIISYEGEIKIIDFGIAKARMRLVQTQAGVIKGKFRYMSPEQASGELMDHRTDIFAVGVVLYELLRGGPHSLELPDTEVLRRMRRAEFEPLRRQRPDLPPPLEKIVSKALARKPRDRFPTANDFRLALLQALQQLRLSYSRADLAELMQRVFDLERRRRRSGSFAGRMEQVESGGSASAPSASGSGPARAPHSPTDRLPAEKSGGWVAFAPTTESSPGRRVSAHGAEDPLERSPTSALEASPLQDPDEVVPTESYYTLGEDEVELDDASIPTASMDRADLPRAERKPERQPDVYRQDTEIKPARADLNRQDTDIKAARSVTDVLAGDEVLLPESGEVRTSVRPGGQPTISTGFFAQQATGRDQDRPPPKQSKALRLLVGVVLVLVLGSSLAVALYLLEKPLPAVPPPPDSRARAVLVQLDSGLDRAAGALPRAALLKVRSKPPGARIFLCGADTRETTPATISAKAGEPCALELLLEGFETYRSSVTPPITIVATLRRSSATKEGPSSPRGRTGTLRVTSIQVGTVYVNDQAVGRTPKLTVPLAPGTYWVRMHFPALEIQTAPRQVTIQAGRASSLHFDPSP